MCWWFYTYKFLIMLQFVKKIHYTDSMSIKIFELFLKIFFCKLIISISDIYVDIDYNETFCIYRPVLKFTCNFRPIFSLISAPYFINSCAASVDRHLECVQIGKGGNKAENWSKIPALHSCYVLRRFCNNILISS